MSELQVRRILVGIDFDEPSAAAVAAAGIVAPAFGAALTLVHARTIEMPPYFTEAQVDALEKDRREVRARTEVDMRGFAARHTTQSVQVVVAEGPAADAILRLAPRFDLVVLGTHRLRGPRRWWLGSVAEAVVRHAPVPVLVAPVAEPPGHGLHRDAIVMAPETDNPFASAWLHALEQRLHVTVTRTADIATCTPDRLRSADLLVVPVPAEGTAGPRFDAIVRVLKECPHPVLFIPAVRPSVIEGSPS